MSTNGTPPTDEAPADDMRPLPDGDLDTSMPDWLRRPPAWRGLTAVHAASPVNEQDLPEPDTSVIDPRTFVDLQDLPPWLQAIAARGEDAGQASPEVRDEESPRPARESETIPSEVSPTVDVPAAAPPEVLSTPVPEKPPEALDFSTPAPEVFWWQSRVATITLAGLLLVAVAVIVLMATGVL